MTDSVAPMPKTIPTVEERAWDAVSKMGVFGYQEIIEATGTSMRQSVRFVQQWTAEGALIDMGNGPHGRRLWSKSPTFERPIVREGRSAEDNLWTAMRGLRQFTPRDLTVHANTDTVQVRLEVASAYCRGLLAAGYLRVGRKADPATGREAIYKLVKVTGPRPPKVRRVRAIVDPNTAEVHVLGVLE